MMQRTLYIGALCALLPTTIVAQQYDGQELIRNGSFEMLDGKVSTYDKFGNATGWSNATLGLSEIFVKGASPKTIGIPVNDYGTMEPFEGEHYAGFFGWKDDVRRNFGATDPDDVFKPGWNAYSEYLTSELVMPLEKGATYELTFQVALSGNSDRTIMGVGAYFSKVPVKENHRKFLEYVPDVYLKDMITEKGKWTEVRGTFKALGNERYIVIGVFPYVGLESQDMIEGVDNRYAYYYIDAVSMKRVPDED
jgi:OmpA-OmpF porin, OOP family